MGLQYPVKFDKVLAPLVHTDKPFISYIFTFYCKEKISDARSIMNGFLNQLEELLPVNNYFEIKRTISGISEIKVIFTLPKGIYRSKDRGTIYNNKNLSAFKTLVTDNWYNNLIKLKCEDIPKPLSYNPEFNYISNLSPIRGDLEELIKCKSLLIKRYLEFDERQTSNDYVKSLTDSYFKAYKQFKKFDTFVFMLKLPVLNTADNYLTKEFIYNLGLKVPLVGIAKNSLNGIKGNYELFLHIPFKLTKGNLDLEFKFKNIVYHSLRDVVAKEWRSVLLQNGVLKHDEKKELIGENPVGLENIDFNTINMENFNSKIVEFKSIIKSKFNKQN